MFKSLARIEVTATNGNVVRLDVSPDGDVKVAARKGTHNQSVSVIPADNPLASLLASFIMDNSPTD
jgi:hypothetical protein